MCPANKHYNRLVLIKLSHVLAIAFFGHNTVHMFGRSRDSYTAEKQPCIAHEQLLEATVTVHQH